MFRKNSSQNAFYSANKDSAIYLQFIGLTGTRVITMIDQFYFDLMQYLPRIPKELAAEAITLAKTRHNRWLEIIKK